MKPYKSVKCDQTLSGGVYRYRTRLEECDSHMSITWPSYHRTCWRSMLRSWSSERTVWQSLTPPSSTGNHLHTLFIHSKRFTHSYMLLWCLFVVCLFTCCLMFSVLSTWDDVSIEQPSAKRRGLGSIVACHAGEIGEKHLFVDTSCSKITWSGKLIYWVSKLHGGNFCHRWWNAEDGSHYANLISHTVQYRYNDSTKVPQVQ